MKFYLVLDYTLPNMWPKSTQAFNQNDGGSLGLVISLKTHSRFSHLIKRESLMLSLGRCCLDSPIFTMIDSKFHFSRTFTSNLFFWTRNKNDICLKHMTSSTLVKCNGMISRVGRGEGYALKGCHTLLSFVKKSTHTKKKGRVK